MKFFLSFFLVLYVPCVVSGQLQKITVIEDLPFKRKVVFELTADGQMTASIQALKPFCAQPASDECWETKEIKENVGSKAYNDLVTAAKNSGELTNNTQPPLLPPGSGSFTVILSDSQSTWQITKGAKDLGPLKEFYQQYTNLLP